MFFLFPTGTDAPIYYWPFATGGMMLLNTVVLILMFAFPDLVEPYLLHFGTINPLTWITSMFMHDGIVHLVGNLVGLGLFGWIVEGKIGWWRFLLVYFLCGASEGALTQLLMIFSENGAALGASGVVYGLIAISMIWAPENEVRIFYFILFLFYPLMGSFEVTLSVLGFVMIGLEFMTAAFSFFSISSALLHLLGAIPGLVIGVVMIKARWVDCDGFDLLTVMRGKRGERVLTVSDEKKLRHGQAQAKEAAQTELQEGLAIVEKYVQTGHYEMAVKRFAVLSRTRRSLVMTEPQLAKIINGLDADAAKRVYSIPLIQTYLVHYDRHKVQFTLLLARAHILLQARPRLGIKVLKTLDLKSLNPEQTEFVRRLVEKAKALVADGIMEMND